MNVYGKKHGLKLSTVVYDTPQELAANAAAELAELIIENNAQGNWTNIGLATGSSPIFFYKALLAIADEQELSFARVRIFMLDEYYGMDPENELSFNQFIRTHLINKLADFGFDEAQFHIPNGMLSRKETTTHALQYEARISAVGGLDYQLLGIGRNGHIGFNEPETPIDSRTGLRELHDATRRDAASSFFGVEHVPFWGISMGIQTILDARRVRLIATNEGKARTIQALLEGEADIVMPASALHAHADVVVHLDAAAASELAVEKTPWNTSVSTHWDEEMLERYLVWLSGLSTKTLTELSEDDFGASLTVLAEAGFGADVRAITAQAYRNISARICETPGPEAGDTVLVTSPHPDDAEIQVGGTIQRLIAKGVRVVPVIMTSGCIAVWDHCTESIINDTDVLAEFLAISSNEARTLRPQLLTEISRSSRAPGENDSAELRKLKSLVRQNESIRGLQHLGVPRRDIRFLQLPFYETDAIEKDPPTEADYALMRRVILEEKPRQIYAAGDLSDPHGTHRTCLSIIEQAMASIIEPNYPLPELLLYRGAWAEWQLHEMDVIVPLTKRELDIAVAAMRKHRSQIPRAMFPGSDDRSFDTRAFERKTAAGELLTALGVGTFFAAEGFKRAQA